MVTRWRPMDNHRRRVIAALIGTLLLAAALRWADVSRMADMLSFDESYYVADAASLIAAPRLQPFFPNNNGREGGWMVVLAAFMLGAGTSAFAARLAAGFIGVLTVAATYRLGKEMFGDAVGVGAALGMAVLYWPVHFSHLAMRAVLLPLLGALGLALLLIAHRRNQPMHWLMAGLVIGVTVYSYVSAQIWVALEMLLLLAWIVTDRQRRHGALLALCVATVVASPLILYAAGHPDQVLMRARQSATISDGAFANALDAWLRAWFVHGDNLSMQNIPGRPILDRAAAVLFIAGIVCCLASRRIWPILLIVVLAGISIVPSLLSEYPPHFLRAIGLTVPIALVLGLGADGLARMITRLLKSRRLNADLARAAAALMPASLFCVSAVVTFHDFHGVWLNLPEVALHFQRPAHRALLAVKQQRPPLAGDVPVYLAPFEVAHPLVAFGKYALSPNRVGAFDNRQCLVVSMLPSLLLVQPDAAAQLRQELAPWGEVTPLALAGPDQTQYAILHMTPKISALIGRADRLMHFGELGQALELRTTLPSSITARPDDDISLVLRARLLQSSDTPYSLFVHLYRAGASGTVDDQHIMVQGDRQLCPSYPTVRWRPDEVVIEAYNLRLPTDLNAGRYVMAIGIYDSASGRRLRASDPENHSPGDYAVVQQILVSRGEAFAR